jgi:hypothetical protein
MNAKTLQITLIKAYDIFGNDYNKSKPDSGGN